MAYYSIFPEKDTTIYSHPDRIHMNAGKDEALELVEEKLSTGNVYYSSRILIKFKNEEIKDVITNKINKEINTSNCEVGLNLFTSENKNLTKDHIIEAYPLSESMQWEEGSQRYDGNPPSTTTGSLQSANGTTWIYRTESTGSAWPTGSFSSNVTGSYTKQKGGGVWYTGTNFRAENSFFAAADDLDLNLDVTTIVQKFSASYYQASVYPTGLINNGFIIKKSQPEEEALSSSFGELKYFSSKTHTIYSPRLDFEWDDSSYVTSSGDTSLIGEEVLLSLYDNRGVIHKQHNAYKYPNQDFTPRRFRVTARKRYPDRAFVTSSNYLPISYLPAETKWFIRDGETDEVQQSGQLSADVKGHYFDVYVGGLYPERFYKFQFEIPDYSDTAHTYQTHTTILDDDLYFKLVR